MIRARRASDDSLYSIIAWPFFGIFTSRTWPNMPKTSSSCLSSTSYTRLLKCNRQYRFALASIRFLTYYANNLLEISPLPSDSRVSLSRVFKPEISFMGTPWKHGSPPPPRSLSRLHQVFDIALIIEDFIDTFTDTLTSSKTIPRLITTTGSTACLNPFLFFHPVKFSFLRVFNYKHISSH